MRDLLTDRWTVTLPPVCAMVDGMSVTVPEIQGTTQEVAIAKCKAAAKEVSRSIGGTLLSRCASSKSSSCYIIGHSSLGQRFTVTP